MTDRSKALVFRLNDHGQGPEIIRQMFLERGWIEFDEDNQSDEDWNLWWRTSRFRISDYDCLQPWQRLNHYPKSAGITKKDCLARNLKRMKGVHGTGVYNFSPIAFNLPNDYTRFVAEYGRLRQQQHGDSKSLLWICKPADMSRGRGIFLFRDISTLQYDCNAVVQRYISNPLLIGGYKFDLRIYVAVPSFHPLSIYIYEEGIVRFSTEKYDVNSLTNVFSHLTNTSINKHSPSYSTDKEYIGPGCKWTLTQLRHYFHQNNINDNILWIRILNIVILTTLIQAPQVPKCSNCFELYGFDVLIDENLKPWLLEVNFSPSLGADCLVDMIVKKPLLHDIIQLMNFKESDVLRGGEKFKRQNSRLKTTDSADRYGSSSRLSHRSGLHVQRGTSFHKNLSSLSKQSTVEERETMSYIEQDSDDIKTKPKNSECLGLPLAYAKDDSRPNTGSSGISSSHSELRNNCNDEDNVRKSSKSVIKRSKSADTNLNNSGNGGSSRERVKFYIGNKDDNNNIQNYSTSSNNFNKISRSAVTRTPGSSGYPKIDRQFTSSSGGKSEGSLTQRFDKGSIKSSATSDSAISSFSGSSENSDLFSLPTESKKLATPRLLSQRQNITNVDTSSSNTTSAVEIKESSQTTKIKSLRPNGNSSTFRKISALGVSSTPSLNSSLNRSRSRLQTNNTSSSMSSLPSMNNNKFQTNHSVPKTSVSPRQGTIPRNISRNPPPKNITNNNVRYSSQNGISNVQKSQLFVSNSPSLTRNRSTFQGNVHEPQNGQRSFQRISRDTQAVQQSLPGNGRETQLGRRSVMNNGRETQLGNRNMTNSRMSIHRDSNNSGRVPGKSRIKGPAPIIGDFFLGFPFNEASLKAANTTLDPQVIVKETQKLLKEALVKVDKNSEEKKLCGHLPLGAVEWERRLWGPVKPVEEES